MIMTVRRNGEESAYEQQDLDSGSAAKLFTLDSRRFLSTNIGSIASPRERLPSAVYTPVNFKRIAYLWTEIHPQRFDCPLRSFHKLSPYTAKFLKRPSPLHPLPFFFPDLPCIDHSCFRSARQEYRLGPSHGVPCTNLYSIQTIPALLYHFLPPLRVSIPSPPYW